MAEQFKLVHPHSAGIDLGADWMFVSIGKGEVKKFSTFTDNLEDLVKWLLSNQIESVVMEATGVLWLPVYDQLESNGLQAYLVNRAHVKHVPGRKSDVQDCQWLQQLHSYGLLRSSFVPDQTVRALRSYVRLRKDHIQMASSHILHMHKALDLMNLKLHRVISQIIGASRRAVVESILEGNHSPVKLADLCHSSILAKKRKDVIRSLKGNYKAEYIFMLAQGYQGWNFYQDQIKACDKQVEALLKKISKGMSRPENIGKAKPIRHNRPDIEDMHVMMMTLTEGRDPTVLPGITDMGLLRVLSEVGFDLNYWKSAKHFTAWIGLAPKHNTSGKKSRKKRVKGNLHAAQLFREAAQSVAKSKRLVLGAFYQRVKARRGPKIANKATARKLAVLFYKVLKGEIDYEEPSLELHQEKLLNNQRNQLIRKAKKIGLQLSPQENLTSLCH